MTTLALRIRLRLKRAHWDVEVDLALPSRGITVLYGASGSGKTSILRSVAGLERPSSALIQIGDAVWQDDAHGVFVPTWLRSLGYVFQDWSLFEHLDVQRNLEYGLCRTFPATDRQVLEEAIDLLGIRAILNRRPHDLSGGESQRVAIARALVTQPRVLLLDEPLASLDQPRRREIMPWLERLRDQLAIPMIYVTHSIDEMSRLADRVVVLEQGRVLADGAVDEILARGDLPVVSVEEAATVIQGTVSELDARWHLARIQFEGASLLVPDSGLSLGQRIRLRVLARDVSLSLDEPRNNSIQNHMAAVVDAIMADRHPAQAMVRARCGAQILIARVTCKSVDELQLQPGKAVWVQVKSVAVMT